MEQQEKATFDYILADLIGRSIARVYSSTATMPLIENVYPTLFERQIVNERKAELQAEVSAMRFRQFAAAHNKKYKEVSVANERGTN